MPITTIPWGDGSGDNLYFEADSMNGDQSVLVSSDANTGDTDRTKQVNFQAVGVPPQPLQIIQLRGGGCPDFDAWLKDGDTHLWIDIPMNDLKVVDIRIRMIGTIDWGDGNTESVSVTAYTTFTHIYSDIGKYRIDLKPTSGTFYIGNGTNGYNVMGTRSTARYRDASILYQAEIGTNQITTISAYAFYYCLGINRVYVPKTITSIGTSAFSYCYSLGWIEFEDYSKITSVGTNQFYQSFTLKNDINLNFTGTSVSSDVRGCNCLYGYTINPNVTTIPANAFANLSSIKELRCLPTTAPAVANANAFSYFNSACVIKVPIGSLASYQGASSWSTYSANMVEAGTIKMTLTNVTSSNKSSMTDKNASYTTTLTADSGTLGTVTVKMGGVDITSSAYSDGVVTIASVTGNIEITATAT